MQKHPGCTRLLAILLTILIACGPVGAQSQPATLSIASPLVVPTYTSTVTNVQITQDLSLGSNTVLTTASVKPVITTTPINVVSQAGTNGACATAIPATAIVQDCSLGNTAFESNMINLWLGVHGQPTSNASIIYQYGGIELRDQIRSFMFAYLQAIVQEDPSLRSASDQALYNWLQTAIHNNEIQYYQRIQQVGQQPVSISIEFDRR